MRLLPTAPLLVLALAGCDLLAPAAPAGTVTGLVLFNGQPAAGKRVSLITAGKKAITDANGRYTFTGVGAGRDQVVYVSAPDRPEARPNEVATWRSEIFDGGGRTLAPFDVSYNGLLYPDVAMSLIVKTTSPVPFHFSPHVQGGRYRVVIKGFETGAAIWSSDWSGDPTAVFAMDVEPGRYKWQVEIENAAGTGTSPERQVDF